MSRWLFPGFRWAVVMFALVFGGFAKADPPAAVAPAETVEYAAFVVSSSVQLPSRSDNNGIGSRFGDPGDRWTGGRMACPPHNVVDSTSHSCAHRWYPCGTLLIIEYKGQRNWCEVTDRGPYGANVFASDGTLVTDDAGNPAWYVMVHKGDLPPDSMCPDGGCKGRWRGIIDMSPAVSKGMGHPGMGYVKVWRLKSIVDYQKYLATKKRPPTS